MSGEQDPSSDRKLHDTGAPTDEGDNIKYLISFAAHEYVKDKTRHLTRLRDATTVSLALAPDPSDLDEQCRSANLSYRTAYQSRLIESTLPESRMDPAYLKDYARIVHSPSFRRLQGKTQLLPTGENDFFRTRLTHSLEVAEIARRIAMRLNERYKEQLGPDVIDSDIAVCAALLHDIGHPPFGHSGEETLNEKMARFGGFEGNAQTLRIVSKLENRLGRGGSVIAADASGPRGLNLTVGTLASVIKYDQVSIGPSYRGDRMQVAKGYYPSEAATVGEIRSALGLASSDRRLYTIECQVMDIADDIAYSAYDLEDTLEAGIVTPFDLMSIEDETVEAITDEVKQQLAKRIPELDISPELILHHLADVFGTLILDGEKTHPYDFSNRLDRLAFVGRTYAESLQHAKNPLIRRQYLETLIEQNIDALSLRYDESAPFLSALVVEPDRLVTIEALKSFNFHKVISSRRLQLHHHRAGRIVGSIFDALAEDKRGRLLSEHQRQLLTQCAGNEGARMRLISDIVSSFTDKEALRFYDQLHSSRNTPFMSYSR
jgi:dGTPase